MGDRRTGVRSGGSPRVPEVCPCHPRSVRPHWGSVPVPPPGSVPVSPRNGTVPPVPGPPQLFRARPGIIRGWGGTAAGGPGRAPGQPLPPASPGGTLSFPPAPPRVPTHPQCPLASPQNSWVPPRCSWCLCVHHVPVGPPQALLCPQGSPLSHGCPQSPPCPLGSPLSQGSLQVPTCPHGSPQSPPRPVGSPMSLWIPMGPFGSPPIPWDLSGPPHVALFLLACPQTL